MKRTLFFLLLVLGLNGAQAQGWQFLRQEVGIGIGATNFLGELGGANDIGTDFLKDLEFTMTRPTVQLYYRYTFNPNIHARASISWAILSGDDALTTNLHRNNRNLNFKTNLWEAQITAQWFPFGEKLGHIYRMKGAKGKKYSYFSPYLFGGVSVFKFNPKGRDANGAWHELAPLNTEGQGLPGGPADYGLIGIGIPAGIGVKFAITKQWNLGFEISRVLTFTDYIDDASTVYYDNAAIDAAYGPTAAYFADPELGIMGNVPPYDDPTFFADGPTHPGFQRGDPTDNDTYMYAVLSLNYKLLYGKFNLPKF